MSEKIKQKYKVFVCNKCGDGRVGCPSGRENQKCILCKEGILKFDGNYILI